MLYESRTFSSMEHVQVENNRVKKCFLKASAETINQTKFSAELAILVLQDIDGRDLENLYDVAEKQVISIVDKLIFSRISPTPVLRLSVGMSVNIYYPHKCCYVII